MEKRHCPNCNTTLGDHNSYYCSACGGKLPKDLIRTSKAIRIRTYSPSEPDVSKGPVKAKFLRKLKNKTFWAVFALVIIIFIAFVGIANSGIAELMLSKLTAGLNITSINLPIKTNPNEYSKLSLALAVPEADFSTLGLVNHVPAEADFYFEGSNLAGLLEQSLFSFEDENFTPKARILLNNEFSGFSYTVKGENRWGFLFVPKDMQIAQEVFGNGWSEYWKIAFISDYMLLANNIDVFDLVKSVDGGLNLSLAQNPDYVKKEKDLAPSGQLKVIFMSEKGSDIVRDSMGGFTQDIIGMINKVLISSFNSLVITNQDGKN